jgi:arylsulfatase
MERQAKAGKPFFMYVALPQPHLPSEPNPTFDGKTGNGEWADMLAEMDYNVAQMLDTLNTLGIADNTIVIFTSDNGAEFFKPWDGSPGPWRGAYFTALEGGIRVPFLIRWPENVPAGRVSNEIVHGVDMFATLAKFAGAKVPNDRPMDSVDHSPHGGAVAQLEAAFLPAGHDVRSGGEVRGSCPLQPLHRPT